jgi:FtsH-binding integral membrane protein
MVHFPSVLTDTAVRLCFDCGTAGRLEATVSRRAGNNNHHHRTRYIVHKSMNRPETYSSPLPVIELDGQSRGKFISRTYNHLFVAICAFTLIEIGLFKSGLAEPMARAMLGTSWLLVLGGFMVVSWLARGAAHRAASQAAQYAALAGYVLAQAIIFVPLLWLANAYAPGTISSAALITLVAFTALTLVVFYTRKDFSFLRGILMWGGIIALMLIVGGVIFGFQLGTFFSLGMVALAGAAILYDTSNVLHHYPEDRYVAASLELFASVALMLWYVLRLLMSRR